MGVIIEQRKTREGWFCTIHSPALDLASASAARDISSISPSASALAFAFVVESIFSARGASSMPTMPPTFPRARAAASFSCSASLPAGRVRILCCSSLTRLSVLGSSSDVSTRRSRSARDCDPASGGGGGDGVGASTAGAASGELVLAVSTAGEASGAESGGAGVSVDEAPDEGCRSAALDRYFSALRCASARWATGLRGARARWRSEGDIALFGGFSLSNVIDNEGSVGNVVRGVDNAGCPEGWLRWATALEVWSERCAACLNGDAGWCLRT
jgi:hypothetical protein